jgi:hypothetical protein
MAVKSVEEIPVQTNNAINLSHLKSEEVFDGWMDGWIIN